MGTYFEERMAAIREQPDLHITRAPMRRKNVARETNRHGKTCYYYRPSKNAPRIRLPDPDQVGEVAFQLAYENAVAGKTSARDQKRHVIPPYMNKSGRVGYVYFLRMGRSVKIGFSSDVGKRLKSIQTSCPEPAEMLKVIPGSENTERYFHQHFEKYRMTGEWFALEGDLCVFLSVPVS